MGGGIHATHWRAAGRDYGWPRRDLIFVVDLWAPHGQDIPQAWLERFTYIPEFERRLAKQQGRAITPPPRKPDRDNRGSSRGASSERSF